MTPFIIIAQPRTGSTLVCSLLNSVNGVRTIIEPINPIGHTHHMQPEANQLVPQHELFNIEHVLDILLYSENPWGLSNKQFYRASGFKIMAHQILGLPNADRFWQYIRSNKIKIIWVSRNNIVLQYVSDLIVQKTRQAACWDNNTTRTKVKVDCCRLKDDIELIRHEVNYIQNMLTNMSIDYKKLKYEAFEKSYKPVSNALKWLINEKHVLTSKLVKQNSNKLSDRIENYTETLGTLQNLGLTQYVS